jgi:hypothetical protein
LAAVLPDTAPPADDPARMSVRAAARREAGQIPELAHPTGQTRSPWTRRLGESTR